MNLFQDNGFDWLPKNPVYGLPPVIQPKMISSPPTIGEPPASDPGDGGGGQKDGWATVIIMTLVIAAFIGTVIYIADQDAKKNIKRIDGSGDF